MADDGRQLGTRRVALVTEAVEYSRPARLSSSTSSAETDTRQIVRTKSEDHPDALAFLEQANTIYGAETIVRRGCTDRSTSRNLKNTTTIIRSHIPSWESSLRLQIPFSKSRQRPTNTFWMSSSACTREVTTILRECQSSGGADRPMKERTSTSFECLLAFLTTVASRRGLPDIAPQLRYNNEPDSIDRSRHELPARLLESFRLEVLVPVGRRYPERSENSNEGFALQTPDGATLRNPYVLIGRRRRSIVLFS